MYGLVNRAIQQMVCSGHGEEVWEKIRIRADLADLDFFATYESYPDDVTHRLVAAASEVLDLSVSEIMVSFGEYWITYTADEGYEQLLNSTGENLPEFLAHLDQLHAHAGVAFPSLRPPSFQCDHAAENQIDLEYRSHRKGLAPMVTGLLRGLGRRFRTRVDVTQTAAKDRGDGRDVFHIHYEPEGEEC